MTSFPLAGLLRLRHLEEDQAAANLSRAHSRRREVAERADAVMMDLTATSQAPVGRSTLLALAASRASTSGLLGELGALRDVADADLDAAQDAHRAAKAAATSVEKLEERHELHVTGEARRREQLVLDESATRAWSMRHEEAER
jgi:flagellar FliJ protein